MSDVVTSRVMWPNYSKENVAAASQKDNQTLGKDQFLKILITQLQNQDPMQPLQDKEFIAQMAQFTSVEQLMNISSQLTSMNQSLGTVSGLIGKEVTWMDDGSTGDYSVDHGNPDLKINSGVVESIIIRNGVQYAKVGAKDIELTRILEIKDAPAADGAEKI